MTKLFQIPGWNRLSRKKRILISLLIMTVVSIACIHYYFRSHPEGVYFDAYSDFGEVWTLKDGKITSESGILGHREIGSYSWDGESWIINAKHIEFRAEPSMFGASLVDTGRYHERDRRFYPRWWFHIFRMCVAGLLHIHLDDYGGYL